MSELVQQSLNARRCSIRPLFSFLGQIEKDESLGANGFEHVFYCNLRLFKIEEGVSSGKKQVAC